MKSYHFHNQEIGVRDLHEIINKCRNQRDVLPQTRLVQQIRRTDVQQYLNCQEKEGILWLIQRSVSKDKIVVGLKKKIRSNSAAKKLW